jgi:hypothetical protein
MKIGRILKRIKMALFFFKDYYSFGIDEKITDINFAMFKDFYECGELNIVDWTWTAKHRRAKSEIDRIYFYVSYFRPKYMKIMDELLNKWFNATPHTKTQKGIHGFVEYVKNQKDTDDYKTKIQALRWRMEEFIDTKDIEYLVRLMKIKDFLWT